MNDELQRARAELVKAFGEYVQLAHTGIQRTDLQRLSDEDRAAVESVVSGAGPLAVEGHLRIHDDEGVVVALTYRRGDAAVVVDQTKFGRLARH